MRVSLSEIHQCKPLRCAIESRQAVKTITEFVDLSEDAPPGDFLAPWTDVV
jgi:hypothetical protein